MLPARQQYLSSTRQQEIKRQQLQQQQELEQRQAEEAERKRKASEADQMGMEALNRGDHRDAVNHLLAALEFDPQNPEIRAHLDKANKALHDQLDDARSAAELLALRQEIEDATTAADIQAMREQLEDEVIAQQLAAISKDLRGHAWREYRLSGNGFIGGTSWLVGYNVQNADPSIVAKEKQMLQKQMELSGKEYAGVDFQRYNFVLGIGASTNILLDLKNRVVFDEFKNGQFSAREQALYSSLKDRQFGELACHSNGAMICLAALENQDVRADRVVLYGPQITRESLQLWNELVRSGYVKSLQIYVNQNDPVPPFSLALGDLFLNFPQQASLFNPDVLKRIINETSPKISVHTFSCGKDYPTLDCHDMAVYKRQRLFGPTVRQDGARNLASRQRRCHRAAATLLPVTVVAVRFEPWVRTKNEGNMNQSTARARGVSGRSLLLRRVKSDCKECQQGGSSDGFVIGNGDGILGVVSGAASTPRAFATDLIAINTIAVSSDGRFIAAGNSFGAVEVWELR